MVSGILILLLASPLTSPQKEAVVRSWVQTNFEALTIYRDGDTAKALSVLETLTLEEQRKAVSQIRRQLERIAAGGPPEKGDVVEWTPRLLRALASLHMEAALEQQAQNDGKPIKSAAEHIKIGKDIFDILVSVVKENDGAAARWLLALGLEQMRKGQFDGAFDILIPACSEHDAYAALQVACGSLHETYSVLPDDRSLARGRNSRTRHLANARDYLERSLRLDRDNSEAKLRLAHVRLRQGDEREAAALLEQLLARGSVDLRESYLGRLFLARIRDRQQRLDEVTSLLAAAPPGQSVLIAQARNALRKGNSTEAAALAARAAARQDDDLWWGYRFGQYWVAGVLFEQLRGEARK